MGTVNDEPGTLNYLYLTTTGRKTRLPREIEIWFVAAGGRYYVLAEHGHRAQWVKNIQRDSRVSIRLRERQFQATARVLDLQRDAEAWQAAQRLSVEKYGWGAGTPVEIVPGAGP